MPEPLNRTILLLDIERFSRRDDVVQAVLRRALRVVVDQTLVAAGVEPSRQYREDRGDGLIVLLGADVPKTSVLRTLLTLTPELLHDHNRLVSTSAQMRLRMVLTSGEVAHDPQDNTVGGLVGHDLNQAFRLLESDALRTALAGRSPDTCVLAVGDAVYQGVVRHGYQGIRPDSFAPAEIPVKDGTVHAWLHLGSATGVVPAPSAPQPAPQPGGATAPHVPRPPEPTAPERARSKAVFHFHGAPVIHGSFVAGDQHGVSGGRVSGDVILGGQHSGNGFPPEREAGDEPR
ncbi:hypothetical protein OU787_14185 [Kitasatospora sp. YST-16]|uniref:hypothetical protein n=1 Tax=Kitasatospora sp. YST-16 TaxID=2998080 RepID=UPI002283A15A|nr:hypothetical protein [Kitasatospora sp. YST-16]WAL72555.1 hypothetical protein OU787_14185 [Kitasatospora sp. YST-16]WNW38602.1 hypothetical protein RKE32_14130 [Streptomyces sp. Li-HN-5-13]